MVEPLPIAEFEDETVVSEKPSKFSRSKSKKSTPEVTMSNPHYKNDLKVLDGNWDLSQIINSETIFILSGCRVSAELLVRPVAEMLRDEIDRLGNPSTSRRAIVIADWWWWQEEMDKAHPIIAVGGPASNGITREVLEKVEAQENDGLCTAFVYEEFPKVAVWGETSLQTKESVEQFIRNDLRSFLDECWK